MSLDETRSFALKYAVLNASQHGGKAREGPVLSKILAELPHLREKARELLPIVSDVVEEVNSWPYDKQQLMLNEKWPELLEIKVIDEKRELPPLLNVDRFEEIRTRFAPNPDGPLHLGSARPIILCDEYAKIYRGKFILRYEDTSPDVKPPILEMYKFIIEDLKWLDAEPNEVYVQSERLPLYYEYCEKLLAMGAAYVCVCPSDHFREIYLEKKACPCRDLQAEVHLDRWMKMLDGTYMKGEAVVRIKTDLSHPNPALRDWPALRISTTPHPRLGEQYRVWPLYNFSCAIDDHELAISHIIRGKEHEVNTARQRYIYKHLGWDYPEIINVGRLGLELGILSKSKIRAGVKEGQYSGWDDPRLGTLRALKRRGIQPETIRKLMIQVGSKPVNAILSWENMAAVNRGFIEAKANRFFFVSAPVPLHISSIYEEQIAELPLHPDHPERGTRDHTISPDNGKASIIISRQDSMRIKPGDIVRLMGLMNIEIIDMKPKCIEAQFNSREYKKARKINAPFIHWLPIGVGIQAQVVMPDSSVVKGLIEPECLNLKAGDIIQFERFGFVKIDSLVPFVAYYAHR